MTVPRQLGTITHAITHTLGAMVQKRYLIIPDVEPYLTPMAGRSFLVLLFCFSVKNAQCFLYWSDRLHWGYVPPVVYLEEYHFD
jgi:hypothetical protein